ncbi:hypothetical protein H8D57_01765 [bacterium]|nr:hypothetical protein [bacterium]
MDEKNKSSEDLEDNFALDDFKDELNQGDMDILNEVDDPEIDDKQDLEDISDEELEAMLADKPPFWKKALKYSPIGVFLLSIIWLFWAGGIETVLSVFLDEELPPIAIVADQDSSIIDSLTFEETQQDGVREDSGEVAGLDQVESIPELAQTSKGNEEVIKKTDRLSKLVEEQTRSSLDKPEDYSYDDAPFDIPDPQPNPGGDLRVRAFHEKHKGDEMRNHLPGAAFSELTKLFDANITEEEDAGDFGYYYPGLSLEEFSERIEKESAIDALANLSIDSTGEKIKDILYSPLAPSKEWEGIADIPLYRWYKSRELKPEPDSVMAAKIDTTVLRASIDSLFEARYLEIIDSLKSDLFSFQKDIARVDVDNRKFKDQLKKQITKQELDSLRALNLKKLARIIEKMNPDDAAFILNNKSSKEVVDVLFAIKPRSAAKILGALSPELGSEVTMLILRK